MTKQYLSEKQATDLAKRVIGVQTASSCTWITTICNAAIQHYIDASVAEADSQENEKPSERAVCIFTVVNENKNE